MENDPELLELEYEKYRKRPIRIHLKGFLIFLEPDELDQFNEYEVSDPYTVEDNIDGEFHKRRIECTLELISDAIKATQNNPKILDLGCGKGLITNLIQSAYPNADLSALDYSVSAIEYAVECFPKIDFIVANAYKPLYSDSYFDIIILNNLIEHIPDPIFLLSSISRILKPSGFIIISTPSRYRLENLILLLTCKQVNFMSNHHVTEYSVGQIIELCRYAGYKVTRILGKPIRTTRTTNIRINVIYMILSPLFAFYKNKPSLESTVFYLAQRTEERTPASIFSQDSKR